jgi:hypothetical protein
MAVTVRAVLQEHGYTVPEKDVAQALANLLPPRGTDRVAMAGDEVAFLAQHSGIAAANDAQLRALDARSIALSAAEAFRSWTRGQIAERLGLDPSRISHMTAAGALFAYPRAPGRLVYPDWQLHDGSLLPHLKAVLAAIPSGSHPFAVRRFMTVPDDELLLADHPVSPRDWLIGGGNPAPVVALARTLGEQE